MNLKMLMRLKAAGAGKVSNLLKVTTANAARFSDGYNNWTEEGGVVSITGKSRGGYYATINPGVTYVYSYETEGSFQQRIYSVKEDRTLDTLIYNQNTKSAEFSFEGEEAQEFVFGFYVDASKVGDGFTIEKIKLVEKGA